MNFKDIKLPDDKTLILGVIRDADNALDFDTIAKRSGYTRDMLEPVILSLVAEDRVVTFENDRTKPLEIRRFHTNLNDPPGADALVAEHLWELSASGLLYFAYGCDLDPEQMYLKRCPGSHYLCRAALDGFRLAFDRYSAEWGGGQASFRRCENSTVWGALYHVKPEHWSALDNVEVTPYCRRVRVPVKTSFGLFCAECYQSFPAEIALPSKKYLDKIISGGHFFGLPQKYLRLVGSIPVANDSKAASGA
ncbi:hypothetical protein DCCM_3181 [Desulfocucumis palustris]|uniref:Gamma-glutamylcyclotransferase AIG2-like domain-containing protein n=1 Tax=Desulfocucumis palustris TaxID=1898651 RepID=A0A2L2XCK6_9FIRM|nr:gamma-glutamylcyclotransferase family protein [Desulfocucumis palustris]GBF34069.1 hypothetical protein DCCM_3181 [Desulfocucumis palustris]